MNSTVLLLLNQEADLWADAMLRACWQGGLFICMVWTIGRLLPRLPASLRCGLWWLSCLKLLSGLTLTFAVPLALLPVPREQIAAQSSLSLPLLHTEPGTRASLPRIPVSDSTVRPSVFPTVASSQAVVTLAAPLPALPPRLSLAALFLMFWLVGQLAHLILAARQFRTARRLLRESYPLENAALLGEAEQVAQGLGLRRRPAYRVARHIASPVVVGLLHPVVLIPENGFDTLCQSQRAMALAHELAHLRRGDLWLSLLPVLIQSLFFFYPLAWLARYEFAVCREAACDSDAVRVTEQSSADYGQLLLNFTSAPSMHIAIGLGASSGYRQLQRRLMMLQCVSTLSRRSLRGSLVLLLPISLFCMLPWRVVAASSSDADALADNPALEKKVEIDAEGIPLREFLALISKKTGVSLQADAYVADEKIVLFSPARPLKEVMADVAALFNDRWLHYKSEKGTHTYSLVRYREAKEYEDGLDVAALTHINTQLDALTHALDESPEQLAKRPANDVLRRFLTDPDSRFAAQIYAGITPEQRARLFQEAKIHLPFSALAPAQQEEARKRWLEFLEKQKQRKLDMPNVPSMEFKPDDVQRKGVNLSVSNGFGRFQLAVHPTGGSINFQSEHQWQLPAHGNPYTRKTVPLNVSLPEAEPLNLAIKETNWLDRLHTLAKTSGKTVLADYYRARTVALPGPFDDPDSQEAQRGDKQRAEIGSLDKFCHPEGYLWWAGDKALFFRKRDWYTQMRYEIPDSWLLALPAHLKAQKNHLTYGDVFDLLALTTRQIVGLNSMRFRNEPVDGHYLGESDEADLAGLQDLLTLAKTVCPNPDNWLPRTSDNDRTEGFYNLKDLTPTQGSLLSSFLEKQSSALEYSPDDACFLQI